jgi:hypothetical protein
MKRLEVFHSDRVFLSLLFNTWVDSERMMDTPNELPDGESYEMHYTNTGRMLQRLIKATTLNYMFR